MAQLKDTVIMGNLSVTGHIYPAATLTYTSTNSGGTSVTPAGTVTGSLSGTVLTLGFTGTAASHSHTYDKTSPAQI